MVVRAVSAAFLALLVILTATPVGAQTATKNDLTVFGGLSLIDLTTTKPRNPFILQIDSALIPLIYPPPIISWTNTFEGGGEFGVRYGRDLTDALTLTGDFSIVPGHALTVGTSGCSDQMFCIAAPAFGLLAPDFHVSERVTAYHYGGGLRLNLVRASVTSATLTPSIIAGIGGVTFTRTNRRDSTLAFRVGAGLSASFHNLSAGIEALDVIVSDHFVTAETEHDVHVRLTFGVRW